jgi:hypothetical protein
LFLSKLVLENPVRASASELALFQLSSVSSGVAVLSVLVNMEATEAMVQAMVKAVLANKVVTDNNKLLSNKALTDNSKLLSNKLPLMDNKSSSPSCSLLTDNNKP